MEQIFNPAAFTKDYSKGVMNRLKSPIETAADDTKVIISPKEDELNRTKYVLTNCDGEFFVDKGETGFSRAINEAVLFDSKQQIDDFLAEKGGYGEFGFNTLLIVDSEMTIAQGSRYNWALFEGRALIPLSFPDYGLAPCFYDKIASPLPEASTEFKKMPSGEVEIRDYVVFYSPNKDEYKFYNTFNEEPKITILGQPATLLTESAAEDMANALSRNSPKSWFYYKADYFLRKEK